MPLPRAPLLLLGVALGSFVLGALCGSPSHSLRYFYLHLPEPSQGLPQFSIRSYLDDQPIAHYNSHTRKMEPLVPWMEEGDKENFLAPERVFRADLEKLSKLDHRAGGLHTWQVMLGCELMEDRGKGGFFRHGYDGMDFISFDKEALTWVPAQPQARKLKRKWEDDPGWSERNKFFLEETCIEWLQRYLSCKNKTLQRIEPPVGKVTRKKMDNHREVLICQAFGFYSREIQATWTRDGQVCDYETLPRNVAPNSDGTYYVCLSIEIDPKERDCFRCRLEHQGLQEPLILAWKEETALEGRGFLQGKIRLSSASLAHQFRGRREKRGRSPEQELGHAGEMGDFSPGRTGGEGEKENGSWGYPGKKGSLARMSWRHRGTLGEK
ncbi:major histocompatibility complex class I-related protein-like [Crotalus adamanteus]|uniref:Major histocompatibility complex class I-related protein-like n=1 Tax=Crotalus adamanteus TaxID=8729 RepID=A0AAW1BTB8_CROAD